MSQGPSLQGQIVINTQSVDKAITSVRKLQTNVEKSFGLGGRAAAKFSQTLDKQTKSYDKVANSTQKYQNIIAKAANQVANYESAVRKSNATDSKKADLIKKATAQLKGFEQAVKGGADSGKALNNVNTQLAVSMGQLKRDLTSATQAERTKIKTAKELEASQVRTDKAVSQSSIQYQKAAQAVKDSQLAEADKLKILTRLDQEHKKLTQTLTQTNTTTRQASSAQNRFRESLAQVNQETRKSRISQQAAATNKYATEMRNLSTSVVVALGPLSGVASRLTALTTLFNRNAASIAVVLASMTALSVLFSKAATYAEEAEKQMFRINAQLEILGDTAQVTGADLNEMAHQIAGATLLSAKEVRDASGALIEFGGIGRSQFADVTKVAQGMSVVFGGNLRSNIRMLGRAIDEPTEGLQRLKHSGIILDDTTKELIKSLSAQGRTFEATNVLLKETTSLQKAAEGEAKGLAGAYDTVSGNLDRLYENLFITSGASEALAKSVGSVANAIAEFSKSADAKALGGVFLTFAKSAGTAFEFVLDNIKFFGAGLALIAGSVVPKALIALGTLTFTGFKGLGMQVQLASAKLGIYTTASAAAEIATKKLTFAMKANPILAAASAVMTLVGAIWAYNSVMDNINGVSQSMNAVLGQVRDQIAVRNDLTKAQADGFREELSGLERVMAEQKTKYEDAENREKDLLKSVKRRAMQEVAYMRDTGKAIQYLEQLKSIEGLIALSKTLEGEEKKQVDNLILARRATEVYKKSMEDVEKAARGVGKAVADATPGTEANSDLEKQLSTVKDLEKTYLKESEAIKKLQADLKETKEVQQELLVSRDHSTSIKQWNEINEKIKSTGEVIKAIGVEMQELSVVELSKEAEKLEDIFRDVNKEAVLAMAAIRGSDAQMAVLELSYEMSALKREVDGLFDGLSRGEVDWIAEALPGVDEASSLLEVRDAFLSYTMAQKEATLESNNMAAASGLLKQHREDEKSQILTLIEKYGELQRASVLTTGTPDVSLADWYEAEKAKIESQASTAATSPFTNLDTIQAEYAQRKELLAELYKDDEEQYQKHLKNLDDQQNKSNAFMKFAEGAETASNLVGQAMSTMQSMGKENAKAYQALAIGEAVISGALAATKAWEASGGNPAIAIPTIALIGAQVGAQIAAIRAQSFATGGYVSGPGTATSDSISANLSNGEFVMQAEAVKAIGRRNLDSLNAGQVPSFSGGGPVSPMPAGSLSGGGASGGVNFTIIDNSSGDKQYSAEETVGPDGRREIKVMVDNAVKQGIASGQYDREMTSSFGVKRQGRGR